MQRLAACYKLVRAFGEKVFDIIESTPERLREVNGIGPIRAAGILAAWACALVHSSLGELARLVEPRVARAENNVDLKFLLVLDAVLGCVASTCR